MTPNDLITRVEAMEKYKIANSTFNLWIKTGKLAYGGKSRSDQNRPINLISEALVKAVVEERDLPLDQKTWRGAKETDAIRVTRAMLARRKGTTPCAYGSCEKLISLLCEKEGELFCSTICCRLFHKVGVIDDDKDDYSPLGSEVTKVTDRRSLTEPTTLEMRSTRLKRVSKLRARPTQQPWETDAAYEREHDAELDGFRHKEIAELMETR